MNYFDILQAVKNDLIVRLRPSPIAGVGVFAVTRIEKDSLVFKPKTNYLIPWSSVPSEAIQYFLSICNTQSDGVILDRCPNDINTSYYVNHSNTPNLHHDLETDEYWAIRDIEPGEELTCFYLPRERDWNVLES